MNDYVLVNELWRNTTTEAFIPLQQSRAGRTKHPLTRGRLSAQLALVSSSTNFLQSFDQDELGSTQCGTSFFAVTLTVLLQRGMETFSLLEACTEH